ncbi:hypothetical protein ACFLWO_00860 [Chloroflexota bacterium]
MKKLPDYRGWDLPEKQTVEEPAHTMEGYIANLIGLLGSVATENVALVRQDSEGHVAFDSSQAGQAKPRGLVILIGIP